jgi:hypothetical protein
VYVRSIGHFVRFHFSLLKLMSTRQQKEGGHRRLPFCACRQGVTVCIWLTVVGLYCISARIEQRPFGSTRKRKKKFFKQLVAVPSSDGETSAIYICILAGTNLTTVFLITFRPAHRHPRSYGRRSTFEKGSNFLAFLRPILLSEERFCM